MFRLWHKLFGWDYIYWQNSADAGVAKVWRSPDNRVYYQPYTLVKFLRVIKVPTEVFWLTCKAEKYFP